MLEQQVDVAAGAGEVFPGGPQVTGPGPGDGLQLIDAVRAAGRVGAGRDRPLVTVPVLDQCPGRRAARGAEAAAHRPGTGRPQIDHPPQRGLPAAGCRHGGGPPGGAVPMLGETAGGAAGQPVDPHRPHVICGRGRCPGEPDVGQARRRRRTRVRGAHRMPDARQARAARRCPALPGGGQGVAGTRRDHRHPRQPAHRHRDRMIASGTVAELALSTVAEAHHLPARHHRHAEQATRRHTGRGGDAGHRDRQAALPAGCGRVAELAERIVPPGGHRPPGPQRQRVEKPRRNLLHPAEPGAPAPARHWPAPCCPCPAAR